MNARCSIVTASPAPVSAGDRSPRGEGDDSKRCASAPVRRRAQGRAPGARDARTPSTSARTGTLAATTATAVPDTDRLAPPRPQPPSRGATHGGNARQRSTQLPSECRKRFGERRRATDDDQGNPARRGVPGGPIRLPQPATGAIPLNGVLELSAHGEPGARRFLRLTPQHDEGRSVDASASLEERLEFGAGGQPLASREAPCYTASRFRPLARRRRSTFRPPFVFMRSRKPCVLARRRRLGWNVRFMTALPFPLVEPPQCRQHVRVRQPTKGLATSSWRVLRCRILRSDERCRVAMPRRG
jgi:hypothetical protein